MIVTYNAPAGQHPAIYSELLNQIHMFIAGVPGSGKSVVINGMIQAALYRTPLDIQFIFIDPKIVELAEYSPLPHTIRYASGENPAGMVDALKFAVDLMMFRYHDMKKRGEKMYTNGPDIYVIIDELADLMTTNKRQVEPLILRILQLGRAAKMHLIMATQQIYSDIISGPIRANVPTSLGLHTRDSMQSRMVIGCNGCETLPQYGYGHLVTPNDARKITLPMYNATDTARLIAHWSNPVNVVDVQLTPDDIRPGRPAPTKSEMIRRALKLY